MGQEKKKVLEGAQAEEANTKRTAVLVGRVGAAKSTLTNMLVGGQPNEPAKVGHGPAATTIECNVYSGRDWKVVDTVGLGEPFLATAPCHKAAREIRQFLRKLRGITYTHLIFVVGDLSSLEDRMILAFWHIFCNMFHGREQNFVVLFTKTTKRNFTSRQNDMLRTFGDKTHNFTYVDFPIPPQNGKQSWVSSLMGSNAGALRTELRNLEKRLNELFPPKGVPEAIRIDGFSGDHDHDCGCMDLVDPDHELVKSIRSVAGAAAEVAISAGVQSVATAVVAALCTIS